MELKPHPEGGYFKEPYRSDLTISKEGLSNHYSGSRVASTAIYFLLTKEEHKSYLHKLKSDEIFHLYDGGSVEILLLYPSGDGAIQTLGSDLEKGERPQVLIPKGTWFGGLLKRTAQHALIGCTVAPGFEFEDFTLEIPKDLVARYSGFSEMIEALMFKK